jgi:hypothetical protein
MVRPVGSLKNALRVSLLCGFCSAGGGTWGNVVLNQQLTQSNCQMPILRTNVRDAKLAQKLGQLPPIIAAFPQKCEGQLAYFGPT